MEGLCPMGAEKISQRQMLHTLPMIRSEYGTYPLELVLFLNNSHVVVFPDTSLWGEDKSMGNPKC